MVGCAASKDSLDSTPENIELSGCTLDAEGAPQFYGPWKGDIEHAYASSATSDRAKQILCGGSITAEHVAEMNAALKSCLGDAGFRDVTVDEYGVMDITTSSDVAEGRVSVAERVCEDTTGWYPIVSLYGNMRQNPNKGDMYQLLAQCLVRVGLDELFQGVVGVGAWEWGEGVAESVLLNPFEPGGS
ncbi:MAG: hypothetical protein LBV00_12775, partial [Propionibacteriaceae bacterium]|nr:hypothetical protein [Propionibacteriaceae bacterium]